MNIKRLESIDIATRYKREVQFIKEQGLLFKYLTSRISMTYKDLKENEKHKLETQGDTIVDDVDKSRKDYGQIIKVYEHFTIDDEDYYLETSHGFYILYKVVPLLINDKDFEWKDNAKYESKEAVIKRGAFEYLCIVNADGNGKVIVRYTKCENFHRNKVTIAEFHVPNAYNEVFLTEINKWNKEFKESIAA